MGQKIIIWKVCRSGFQNDHSKINHVGTTINCILKGRNTTLLSLYVCCEFVRRFNGQINMFFFVDCDFQQDL